ncbi:hypothetical protein [Cellulomonas gilvus]|nr:hypothetical protein [Cellulomonas gilvus]
MSADLPEPTSAPSGRRAAATAVEPVERPAAPASDAVVAQPGADATGRGRGPVLAIVIVVALVVVAVGAIYAIVRNGGDDPADATATASIARGTAQDAQLRLEGGAASITVAADAASSDLASLDATGADAAAELVAGEPAVATLAGGGASTVRLAPDVTWTLDLGADTDLLTADLGATSLAGLTVTAGARLVELALPAPEGTVVIDQQAGVGGMTVQVPADVPVLVKVVAGAGTVTIDGEAQQSVGAGEELTTEGFSADAAHYEILLTAGLGELTITRG